MKTTLTILSAVLMQTAMAATPDPWAVNAGPLRISGPAAMRDVVERWTRGFAKEHPEITVDVKLAGTDVGYGALVTGRTDIAFGGREIASQEAKAFEWIFRYQPTGIDVANGSVDRPGRAAALAVLVHKDNPMRTVTFAQLKRFFDADRQDGKPGAWETWGDAGLHGSWAKRTIHLYMPPSESGTGAYFRKVALASTRAFPWSRVTETDDTPRIAAAVARDPSALAVVPMARGLPSNVKLLALSSSEEGRATPLTRQTVETRQYPLARSVRAYVNAAPASPVDPAHAHALDPRAAAFLAYVLGPDGQRDVELEGSFVKLDPVRATGEAARLK